MNRRPGWAAAGLVVGMALLAGFCAGSQIRDRGLLADDLEPIDLLEQAGANEGRLTLPRTDLAERCVDEPRSDCDAVLSAVCWDGPEGLTQYACFTTLHDDSWRQLPEAYEVPVRSFRASANGDRLILDRAVADRDGTDLGFPIGDGQRWFRSGELLMNSVDGVVEITELDGTVVEVIEAPPPYVGSTSFGWGSWALSHDESMIVVLPFGPGVSDSEIWLYDRDGQMWSLLEDDPEFIYLPLATGLGFSPDDRTVITARIASDDDGSGSVRRWWIVGVGVDGKSTDTLREVHADGGIRTSVSPNGRFVALSNAFCEIRILNLETLEASDRANHCWDQWMPTWSPGGLFLVAISGQIIEVIPDPIPLVLGTYDLEPPDPQDVLLPLVQFQPTNTS